MSLSVEDDMVGPHGGVPTREAGKPPLGPTLRRAIGVGLLGIAFIMILWAIPLIWFLRLVTVPLGMVGLAVIAIIIGLYLTRDRERGPE